jgi:hypothetical protein
MTRRSSSMPSSLYQMLWSLVIVFASVVGGLAAATLVHLPSRWIAVVVPAVIGSAIALAAFPRRPGLAKEQGQGQGGAEPGLLSRPDDPYGHTGSHHGDEEPKPSDRRTAPPAVVQVHPVSPPAAADTPWWAAAQAAPRSARSDASVVPAPDLSSYLASAMIAQCPRCGAFRLDIRRALAGWACRCESCGHTWAWQPGTAWPEVRVAPRRRRQPATPDPNSRNSSS